MDSNNQWPPPPLIIVPANVNLPLKVPSQIGAKEKEEHKKRRKALVFEFINETAHFANIYEFKNMDKNTFKQKYLKAMNVVGEYVDFQLILTEDEMDVALENLHFYLKYIHLESKTNLVQQFWKGFLMRIIHKI